MVPDGGVLCPDECVRSSGSAVRVAVLLAAVLVQLEHRHHHPPFDPQLRRHDYHEQRLPQIRRRLDLPSRKKLYHTVQFAIVALSAARRDFSTGGVCVCGGVPGHRRRRSRPEIAHSLGAAHRDGWVTILGPVFGECQEVSGVGGREPICAAQLQPDVVVHPLPPTHIPLPGAHGGRRHTYRPDRRVLLPGVGCDGAVWGVWVHDEHRGLPGHQGHFAAHLQHHRHG
mmetsp:Transcript_22604/g.55743  ORF Transcript_22604/g.55743 Transcript_22604/m.55743 type:complete len:227 (+) Transcript_22604:211-891(+)